MISVLLRYGLYGCPLESELFDIEPPLLCKPSASPTTYASVVLGSSNGQVNVSSGSNGSTSGQTALDFRSLLGGSSDKHLRELYNLTSQQVPDCEEYYLIDCRLYS